MANELKHRIMADQSIARSFKGILRVADIKDLKDGVADEFFNKEYYGAPTGALSSIQDKFYDSAYRALMGATVRYSVEDEYRENKVPVTDSLGYYINLNLGAESSTIGSDDANNGNSEASVNFTQLLQPTTVSQKQIFPVLETKTMSVGLESRVLPSAKKKVGVGKVFLDDTPTIKAQLITHNNYDHSDANITNGTTYKAINKNYRTVIRLSNENLSDYDVLMHRQDNIDWTNYNSHGTLDAFVDVVNLKDYVRQKVEQYVGSNVDEMLPGTINFQYISLTKWYCLTEQDDDKWAGHRPPMNQNNYKGDFMSSTYQKVCKKINTLSTQQDAVGQYSVPEVIPVYKRDYLLCDGAPYTIYTLLPDSINKTHYESFERFIRLFYAIGYHYTELEDIHPQYMNVLSGGKYVYDKLATGDRRVRAQYPIKDKEVLWALDVAKMLAVRMIYEELRNGTSNNGKSGCLDAAGNRYSRTNAENWLKTAPIPDEFIFPAPAVAGQGMKYAYKTADNNSPENRKTINFEVGREVSTFSQSVKYWRDSNNQYVMVPLWQTAEVQEALDIFDMLPAERDAALEKYFAFTFRVPNFKMETDKYTLGCFVGSSPYYWSEEAKDVTHTESITTWDDSQIPHRHYIMQGLVKDPLMVGDTGGVKSNLDMVRGEGPYWFFPSKNDVQNPKLSEAHQPGPNYIFCDIEDTYYQPVIWDGIATKIIQIRGVTNLNDPDPRWQTGEPNRGVTSPPIYKATTGDEEDEDTGGSTIIDSDAKRETASANSGGGDVEYFSPECMLYLPLIKL